MAPAGNSTVICFEEHKTLGFATTGGLTWVVLGGLGDTATVTGAGVSWAVWCGHCKSKTLYSPTERSQYLRSKESVVEFYRKTLKKRSQLTSITASFIKRNGTRRKFIPDKTKLHPLGKHAVTAYGINRMKCATCWGKNCSSVLNSGFFPP